MNSTDRERNRVPGWLSEEESKDRGQAELWKQQMESGLRRVSGNVSMREIPGTTVTQNIERSKNCAKESDLLM